VEDDLVSCTDESCDEVNDVIVHTPNDANCDNGQFCDGAETCDAVNDCQAGVPPVEDDLVACTDESCDEVNDVIVHTANDANCDNGLFCDGAETCDAVNDCQAGSAPCAVGETCNETDDICEPPVGPPVAHPGPDQTIDQGVIITLGDLPSATGGTPPYTYSWSVDPPGGVTLHWPTDENPMLSGDQPGVYVVTLVVTDSLAVASLPATATITVTCPTELDLFNQVIAGKGELFLAVSRIWLGDEAAPLSILGSADVTFRAGESIILRSGTQIESGAKVVFVIDPTMDPTTCN